LEALIRDTGASCVVAPYAWWCYLPDESGGGAAALDNALPGSLVSSVRDLVPLVADIDPDVICTQTIVIPWGAAVAAALGKPHIWSVCEYGELDHGLQFVPSFREIAADIERCSDFVFFAIKDIKSSLFPTLSDDRWDVLYRHIETELPWEIASIAPSAPRPLQLAIVGTLSATKGQADAIAAVALLKSRGLAVELTVVGRGQPEYLAELRRRVDALNLAQDVHFVDFLINPFPTMSRADVALVCSRREAFGRVAVEAMLLGKSVVYAAAGGITEYMRDGETGLSYPPGDTTALADRIETLLRDKDLRARLGAAAQAYARSAFTRDGFSGKFHRKALELRGSPARAQFPTSLLPALQRQLTASAELVETIEREKAGLQESLSRAERCLSDSSAALDQRTALLAEAQGRIATLETSLADTAARLGSLPAGPPALLHPRSPSCR
jgi:glycosyltransferase involved in cell wall biosynthesis